jgi:hypothetical protein
MRSISLVVLFISFSFILPAQEIQPVLQSGHSSKIEFYSVSYEKNLLMTADANEVMLWNTLSGRQLRRIASPFKIAGAALCSNGEEVVVLNYEYNKDASVRVYSSRTGELLSTISFSEEKWGRMNYPSLDELIVDSKFNRIAVRAFSEMIIVDIPKRKKLYQFRLSSYDNNFTFSADQYVFGMAFNEKNNLRAGLADTSGSIIRAADMSNAASQAGMINDPLNNRFYLLDSRGVIHVLDNKLNQVDSVRSDSAESISKYSPPKMQLSADGKKLLVPLHKSHYFYDLEKKQWQLNNWKWIYYSTGLLFANENADKVVKVSERYSVILDAENGKEIHSFSAKTSSNPTTIFSPSGRMMSSFYSSSISKTTTILDLKTGMQFNETEIDYAIFQWITDSVVLCAPYPAWNDKAGEFDHKIEIRNVYSGKVKQSITVMKSGSIDFAAISNDLKKIALVTMKEVFIFSGNEFEKKISYKMPGVSIARKAFFTPDSRKLVLPTEIIRIYDFNNRKWTELKDTASYSFNQLCFTPDSKEMWYEDYKAASTNAVRGFDMQQVISVYNFEKGTLTTRRTFDSLVASIAVHPKEDLYAIGFFNGTIQLRKRSDDGLLYEGKDHHGHIDEIIFAPVKNWMLSRGEDGLIRFMDIDSKQHLVSAALLYSNDERGYALLAPDNSYLVPASLINELHFVKGYETYSFAQLDLKLNRPDKVLERLGMAEPELIEMHRKAYRRRLNKAGYSEETLPDVALLQPLSIINRRQVNYSTNKELLNLKLSTTQSPADIKALNVYVNGQRVAGFRGNTSEWDVPVQLNMGENNIEVAYVAGSGMESLRERIEIKYIPVIPVKVNTYYIGIAVAHYRDTAMNLKYTVKDVTDIAARFRDKDSAVRTYLLTDEKVVKSNLDSIKRILTSTTVNDKVIISFSGHGLLDTAYNFFFAGWDMDFADPAAHGISFSDINNLLDGIPARQKLVLIDACHSGEVDRDVISFAGTVSDTQFVKSYGRSSIVIKKKNKLQNTVKLMEQYFTDVSKNNGANIISAAAGEEYALESSEWNNGVFSYSFMKGFFEKGADKNYDGVSQSEIRKYMQQLVLKLTKGKQQPTSRSINSDFDWHL